MGDLNQCLPYDDEFFDVVFAGEIVEHVFDVALLMSEIRRVLKPGGAEEAVDDPCNRQGERS